MLYWHGGWNCQLLNRGGPFGVPIQWLTTAHKIPCWRGDGSRSGPSPCKAIRDKKPLKSLVTSSDIKSNVVPGLWPGLRRFLVPGRSWMGRFCSVSPVEILDVVTKFSGFCPPRSGGRYFWFFRTGADVSPLQGRASSGACPQVRR